MRGAALYGGMFVWLAGLSLDVQSPPQFRTRTELVQVDVVVLDAQGRPVRGLKASDFTLLDRGKPRTITTFTDISHREEARDAPLEPLQPGQADNTVSASERVVVLMIHDLGASQDRAEQIRGIAKRIVLGLGSRVSMAVVFTSGRGGIEFTNNPDDVLAAIDRTKGQRWDNRGGVNYFIRSVQDVARHLRTAHSQRKAIIAISEGIGVEVLGLFDLMRPRAGRDRTDIPLLAMMTELRRSNVALYAVDPRGRIQTTQERFRESRGGMTDLRMLDPVYWSQESMTLTTEASGGFAIVDTNEIESGLERILTDFDAYYLLGFHPETSRDRWSELRVAVNRPGLTVRHRKGYWPGAKPERPRSRDALLAATEGVLPDASVPLRMSAKVIEGNSGLSRVMVSLQAREPDTLEGSVIAVDLDRKKAVKRWSRSVEDLSTIEIPIELRRGRYHLRGAVRSATTGKTGSVYLLFDVK